MKKLVLVLVPALLLAVMSCVSCNSKKGSSDQKVIDIEEVEELTQEIEDAVYPLPTSDEIIKMLN